jgi:ribosome-binding factor A
MAEPRRLLRLQQLILETLATALQQDVDDPRLKGVTITRVKLAKDLSRALVFWSNLEPGGPRRTAERGIHDAMAYLQALVADAMSTRLTPHLDFKFDEGLERAGRIQQIFDKLAHERGEPTGDAPPPPPPEGDADEDDEDEDDVEDAAPEGGDDDRSGER